MITVAYHMNIWYVNELKELLISRLPSHGIAVKNLLVSFFAKVISAQQDFIRLYYKRPAGGSISTRRADLR